MAQWPPKWPPKASWLCPVPLLRKSNEQTLWGESRRKKLVVSPGDWLNWSFVTHSNSILFYYLRVTQWHLAVPLSLECLCASHQFFRTTVTFGIIYHVLPLFLVFSLLVRQWWYPSFSFILFTHTILPPPPLICSRAADFTYSFSANIWWDVSALIRTPTQVTVGSHPPSILLLLSSTLPFHLYFSYSLLLSFRSIFIDWWYFAGHNARRWEYSN